MRFRSVVFLGLASVILSCMVAGGGPPQVETSAAGDRFTELDEYGDWIVLDGYGRCWRPHEGPGWGPFLYGHWVYTNEGWLWDSEEPFGWIVCHYGNWYNDPDQGWVWVPGYAWSPARVRWFVTDDEIGWAPLFPQPRPGYHPRQPQAEWSFSAVGDFASGGEIRDHVTFRDRPQSNGLSAHVYSGPPRRDFVQRIARVPIATVNMNKVRVTSRANPLIRVEVPNRAQGRTQPPVGQKNKKPETEKPGVAHPGEATQPSIPRASPEPLQRADTSKADLREKPQEKQNEDNEKTRDLREREKRGY
jgi:hypothetical protein